MFFRPRIFPILFVGFFAMMLIGGMRQASYRNAYFDGYRAGQVAAEQAAPPAEQAPAADAAPSANQAPYGARSYGYDTHHRQGIGFFGFLFYLIFFSFMFKVIRRMTWGGGGRHWHSYEHSDRYRPRGERSQKERQADDDGDDGIGFGRSYDM